jgi:CDP-paratose 2-epimerase
MGGGIKNTISLLELLDLLKKQTGKRSKTSYSDWRPSDQKVYISDISKAGMVLGWSPKINPEVGVRRLVDWVSENKNVFK